MQLCAIFSQLHRHKDALDQATESAKLGCLIIQDKIALCQYYSQRIDFEAATQAENNMSKNQGPYQEESGTAVTIDHFSSESEDGLSPNLKNNKSANILG